MMASLGVYFLVSRSGQNLSKYLMHYISLSFFFFEVFDDWRNLVWALEY